MTVILEHLKKEVLSVKKNTIRKSALFILIPLLIMSGTLPGNSSFAANLLQRVEIPSSPNPVGSGARALGMGGAFISVADDATAASWNPGGLIQLELPEISFVAAGFHRIEDISFAGNPGTGGNQTVTMTNLNYLSVAYPFTVRGYNMVVSLNYQNLYDFTRKWNFSLTGDGAENHLDFQSEGNLSALGLTYCVQATPQLSLGITLNFWEDGIADNEWETRQTQWGSGTDPASGNRFIEESRTTDKYLFSGFNVNLGVMWNVNSRLTLGAVLKTPFEADLDHEHTSHTYTQYPELSSRYDFRDSKMFNDKATMDMPVSYGIGVSYRFSDAFSASLDVYRTEWGDLKLTDSDGREISPVTAEPFSESEIDPTHQVRIGVEYILIKPRYAVPIRAGIFYDPAPARDSPDDFYGFSIGSGIGVKWFIFDVAYQYRFGNGVGASMMREWGFSQDMGEHAVYSSVIIHF